MASNWLYVKVVRNCKIMDFEEQVNYELQILQADGYSIKDVKYSMTTARYDLEMYSALILYY